MAPRVKAVISTDREQLLRVREVVEHAGYRTVSEFVREAIDEKLERMQRARLARQVDAYVSETYRDEDDDLVDKQAFPGD